MRRIFTYAVFVILLIGESCTSRSSMETGKNYPAYGGNNAGNRYSPLTQINLNNIKNLQITWTYNAADSNLSKNRKGLECQPIVIDGILYAVTSDLKLFALNAATGKEIWKFGSSITGYKSWSRGVNYWEDGDDKRILYCAGSNIYAVNAKNGKAVESFGEKGKVDLHEGLASDFYDAKNLAITSTSPGTIYKNLFIVGSAVSEEGDALPGHIRGFDVRTGKLLWTFHTIPHPGEPGYETWPKDAYKTVGGANCWSGLVLDEKRGVVYLCTGSPSPNFYGGNRAGKNLYSDCVLALDAESGKLKWFFQTIHHDLWDLDPPCPPNLVTVKHNGKKIDALVQTTKDGLVFVLDRTTGESLFPIEERSVPTTGLPGEQPWPTQNFPLKPHPFTRQVISEEDMPDSSFFPNEHALFKKRYSETKRGYKFMPPSMEGTIYVGISGGAEWGGNATDRDGILYQNSSEMPHDVRMTDLASSINKSTSEGNLLYLTNCASCHGQDRKGSINVFPNLVNIDNRLSFDQVKNIINTGRGRMPSFQSISEKDRNAIVSYLFNLESKKSKVTNPHKVDSPLIAKNNSFPYIPPYITKQKQLMEKNGYPGIKPPWGTLNAIDLNTGEYLWRVPLGEYPELTKRGIPVTGTINAGGPVVTAGGLVFIAGTEDEKFRAFDKKTGKVVWEYQLPAGAFATPVTYEVNGKQYVAIAVGGVRNGHKAGGWYIAFALK